MNETSGDVDFSEGDSLVVDFGTVEEDAGFAVLPRGVYPCVVDDAEFKYSNASGSPMWSLTLEVEDGEYAGRKLFTHLTFKGGGLPITKRHLSRIKPELLETPFDPSDEAIVNSLIGTRLRAKVAIKKYEGEDRNNVRDLQAPEGGGDGGFTS